MNSRRRVLAVLVLLFFSISTVKYAMASPEDAPQNDQAKDRAAIVNTVERFLDAWNKHDAHAFAMTFTEDADFTNVAAARAHGRAGVGTFHARVFATLFSESHQIAEIRSIRFLTPDFAAVDVDSQMTGAKSWNGATQPLRRGPLNWIMARQGDGSWPIPVMRNTELTSNLEQTK